jgi:hypothetical protein
MQLIGGSALALDPPTALTIASSSQWPGSTDTGYKNAPGYPGQLTACSTNLQSGQTYKFCNFSSGLTIPASISNVTFYGCRFASNALDDANVSVYGDNIKFDYSTFEPSAVSAPPTAYNQGYQYGIDQRSAGALTIDHSNFWGWGNAIQISYSSQSKPFIVRNSWFHDARDDGGIDHTDAILENYGGLSYINIDHNTIVSKGNTNGLALQNGGKTGYSNVSVTNNYFSGFGYTLNLCGYFSGCSNYVFTDNTFGTDIKPVWGPLYDWSSANGNVWRRNKWHVVPGSYYTNMADDGKYWTPDGVSTIDYAN